MTPHLQLTIFCSFACRSSWIFSTCWLLLAVSRCYAKKKKHQLLSQATVKQILSHTYLSGNSDYEKLQNCTCYWQWTEKIYLFPLHVLATHRKIQKYFDFICGSEQFSLIPKLHLETCRLLILSYSSFPKMRPFQTL